MIISNLRVGPLPRRVGPFFIPPLARLLNGREAGHIQAAEALRIEPKYTLQGTQARLNVFKRTEDAEHLLDGLRKAGLPER